MLEDCKKDVAAYKAKIKARDRIIEGLVIALVGSIVVGLYLWVSSIDYAAMMLMR